MLKVSAFYLEKQKVLFLKNLLLKQKSLNMALGVLIFSEDFGGNGVDQSIKPALYI